LPPGRPYVVFRGRPARYTDALSRGDSARVPEIEQNGSGVHLPISLWSAKRKICCLRGLLHQAVFVMQTAEHKRLHHPVAS
jgi:hypothetical protein